MTLTSDAMSILRSNTCTSSKQWAVLDCIHAIVTIRLKLKYRFGNWYFFVWAERNIIYSFSDMFNDIDLKSQRITFNYIIRWVISKIVLMKINILKYHQSQK